MILPRGEQAFWRGALVLGLALLIAGCEKGRSASYNYKLTLSVNTPDGIKTGSSVVNLRYFEVKYPMRGIPHELTGDGVYADLGSGRRPLIALLTNSQWSGDHWWAEDDPTFIFARLCLRASPQYDRIDIVKEIVERCKSPFEIPTIDLPDLMTFADSKDPKTIMKVEPDDLSATLGAGVTWRSITLQSTDEEPTKGLKQILPWLEDDSLVIHVGNAKDIRDLPLVINRWNFIRGR